LKNLPIAAILACFLVGAYPFCAKCNAQKIGKSDSAPQEDPCARAAAGLLAKQLAASDREVRDNAAKALEAMGSAAAKALASYIGDNLSNLDHGGVSKAVTVLGKIGNDIADDDDVREALLSAARLPQTEWSVLELRLAALDALGEVNKYRSVLLTTDDDDSMDAFDPAKAIAASKELAKIADDVFEKLSTKRGDVPVRQDSDFYHNIAVVHHSQAELLQLATLVSAARSSSKKKKKKTAEPAFSKLADAKSLAASLRKIEIGYLDATKTLFATTPKPADQPDDKSHWQLETEAAFDFLTEATQLKDELDALSDFTGDRADLAKLLSEFATIPANCELIKAAVASAINKIFSKPPEKKPAAEGAKQDATKEGEKKDADKKDSPAAKDADKEKSKA